MIFRNSPLGAMLKQSPLLEPLHLREVQIHHWRPGAVPDRFDSRMTIKSVRELRVRLESSLT